MIFQSMENNTLFYINDSCNISPLISQATWEIIISVLGIPLNGLAIFIIVALKEYKKSISHWYVLQLAWADTIFLALLPLNAHHHIHGIWSFSIAACKAFQGAFQMAYYAGVLFLTLMSFDRYIAIVHPTNAFWRRFRTRKRSFIATAIVWAAAVLLSVPTMAWSTVKCTCEIHASPKDLEEAHGFSLSEIDEADFGEIYEYTGVDWNDLLDEELGDDSTELQIPDCFPLPWQSIRVWLIVNFVLAFAIPVVVMMTCYGLILRRVTQRASAAHNRSSASSALDLPMQKRTGKSDPRRRPGSSSSQQSRKLKQQRKITFIVVTLILVFLVCWTPFQFVQIAKINGLQLPKHDCDILVEIATILAYSNSMLNPILYTFLGTKLHKRFLSALACFGIRRRGSSVFSKSSRKTHFRASINSKTNLTSAPQARGSSFAEMPTTNVSHSTACPSYSPDEGPIFCSPSAKRLIDKSASRAPKATVASQFEKDGGASKPDDSTE